MPLTGTVVTVKATGGDYTTPQDAFDYCISQQPGDYILELENSNWASGINIDAAGGWPSSISIRGETASDPSTCSITDITSTNAASLTLNSDKSILITSIIIQDGIISLDSVHVTNVNVTSQAFSQAASITSTNDSVIGTIIFSNVLNISLTDTTITNFDNSYCMQDLAGYTCSLSHCTSTGFLPFSTYGSSGGTVIISNNSDLNIVSAMSENVGGSITVNDSYTGNLSTMGSHGGGPITVTNSGVGDITSNSQNSGDGGNVILINSASGHIYSWGTGTGGSVTLTDSSCGNIDTFTSSDYTTCTAGSVYLTDSQAGTITTGLFWDSGSGYFFNSGSVTLINSSSDYIMSGSGEPATSTGNISLNNSQSGSLNTACGNGAAGNITVTNNSTCGSIDLATYSSGSCGTLIFQNSVCNGSIEAARNNSPNSAPNLLIENSTITGNLSRVCRVASPSIGTFTITNTTLQSIDCSVGGGDTDSFITAGRIQITGSSFVNLVCNIEGGANYSHAVDIINSVSIGLIESYKPLYPLHSESAASFNIIGSTINNITTHSVTGGAIIVTDSVVTGTITNNGDFYGGNYYDPAGTSGTITITRSTVNIINTSSPVSGSLDVWTVISLNEGRVVTSIDSRINTINCFRVVHKSTNEIVKNGIMIAKSGQTINLFGCATEYYGKNDTRIYFIKGADILNTGMI